MTEDTVGPPGGSTEWAWETLGDPRLIKRCRYQESVAGKGLSPSEAELPM